MRQLSSSLKSNYYLAPKILVTKTFFLRLVRLRLKLVLRKCDLPTEKPLNRPTGGPADIDASKDII